MAKKNKEIIEQIVDNGSAELQERLSEVNLHSGADVYGVLKDYPTAKNEFINTLTNKIVGSKTYSKIYENQLRMLHKGMLEAGVGLEQLFVEMADAKGFLENFDGSSTVEGDLIRKAEAKVKALYVQRNYRLKYKTSVSEQQLRGAFLQSEGLASLINQLTARNASSAEFKEFNMMKDILKSSCSLAQLEEDTNGQLKVSTTAIPATVATQKMHTITVGDFANGGDEWAKNFAEQVRATAGRLKFPSTKYNLSGVNTWSNREDLVLITTPEVAARLDVRVLAQAFNVSEAELDIRIILVDELPTNFATTPGTVGGATKECYGILMDSAHIQAYDTLVDSGNFYNPDQLVTNLFLHRQGIMAQCLFANVVAFVKE